MEAIAPGLFGLVHGVVGVADENARLAFVVGVKVTPTEAETVIVARRADRLGQQAAKPLEHCGGFVGSARLPKMITNSSPPRRETVNRWAHQPLQPASRRAPAASRPWRGPQVSFTGLKPSRSR